MKIRTGLRLSILIIFFCSTYFTGLLPHFSLISEVHAEFFQSQSVGQNMNLPFISPIHTVTHPFSSIVASWQSTHENFSLLVRTKNRTWSEWKTLESDGDAHGKETDKDPEHTFSQMEFFESGKEFQYKVLPIGKETSVNFSYLEFTLFGQDQRPVFQLTPNQAQAKTDGFVTTRDEWGADPRWIEADTWSTERDKICKERNWYCQTSPEAQKKLDEKVKDLETKFPDDMKIESTTSTYNGKEVLWHISKSASIKKIIVHHTATLNKDQNNDNVIDQQDEMIALRNMYYYHSIIRGWGDIGYNYVVGPTGTVYEGRAGGDKAVGAHAVWRNISSIGVSNMGNFEEEDLSDTQKAGLASALGYLAKKYNLNPLADSLFYGITSPTIYGHRDSDEASTACPGTHIYEKLGELRQLANTIFQSAQFTPFQPKAIPVLPTPVKAPVPTPGKGFTSTTVPIQTATSWNPGEEKSLTVKVKNTGSEAWNENTYLRMVGNGDDAFTVISGKGVKEFVAPLLDQTVPAGEAGSFQITLRARLGASATSVSFEPVANGTFAMSQFSIPVTISDFISGLQVSSVQVTPTQLSFGQKAHVQLQLKNGGNGIWYKSGRDALALIDASDQSDVGALKRGSL